MKPPRGDTREPLILSDEQFEDPLEACDHRRRAGRVTMEALSEAVMEGAVMRIRSKIMTVTAIIGGLLPILWGHGTGASLMKRIAAPMVGGMVSATVLTLVVIPVIYFLWQARAVRRFQT